MIIYVEVVTFQFNVYSVKLHKHLTKLEHLVQCRTERQVRDTKVENQFPVYKTTIISNNKSNNTQDMSGVLTLKKFSTSPLD